MKPIFGSILAACFFVSATSASAQGPGPLVLRLPAGTRALGVGDVFVAGRGSDVIFYNPALIAVLPGLGVSVQRFGDASTLGAISSVFSVGTILAAGVGGQILDYGAPVAGGERALLGERGPVLSSSMAATMALAAQFKGMRFGLAAKYAEERIGDSRDGAPAFDFGVADDFATLRTTVGLAVQNVGPALRIDGAEVDLPMKATLGAALSAPPIATFFDFVATAAVTYHRDGGFLPAGGVELTYVPLDGWAFSGRVGARALADWEDASPLTFGASAGLDRLTLDYAFHALDGPGASHRFGIRLR